MTQTQATTTETDTETNGKGKREPKEVTAVDALKKITSILDQLTPTDRKRVLAFINVAASDNNTSE